MLGATGTNARVSTRRTYLSNVARASHAALTSGLTISDVTDMPVTSQTFTSVNKGSLSTCHHSCDSATWLLLSPIERYQDKPNNKRHISKMWYKHRIPFVHGIFDISSLGGWCINTHSACGFGRMNTQSTSWGYAKNTTHSWFSALITTSCCATMSRQSY